MTAATAEQPAPQNLEAEESILGALMLTGAPHAAVRDAIQATDFYRASHGRVYVAACAVHDRDEPVDPITVVAELERRGWLEDIGGKIRVHELAALVPAASNAPHYARLVREAARAREALALATRIQAAARNGGIGDHPELADQLAKLVQPSDSRRRLTLVVHTAKQVAAWPDPDAGDYLLGDLVLRGGRTIVLGDSGHGKTSLVLQMVAAILDGDTFLQWEGAGGDERALIVDLEQGRKSIKRSLRDASLDQHDRVHLLPVADGLALDSSPDDFHALEQAIADVDPIVLVLDPYYKAHRADDPNAERPIVELMRKLDQLRTRYGFALILPAHPRKRQGKDVEIGARKLTLDDIAGSGALGRAVEVAVAIERLSHGYARFRYLKDREGELPTGDALNLIYRKGDGGFLLDPKTVADDEVVERQIHDKLNEGALLTAKEWCVYLGIREADARRKLESMAEAGVLHVVVGPPGRSKKARCYGVQFGLDSESATNAKQPSETLHPATADGSSTSDSDFPF